VVILGGDKVPTRFDIYVEWFEKWKQIFEKNVEPKKEFSRKNLSI
jgi:hypothetical protein